MESKKTVVIDTKALEGKLALVLSAALKRIVDDYVAKTNCDVADAALLISTELSDDAVISMVQNIGTIALDLLDNPKEENRLLIELEEDIRKFKEEKES